MFLFLLYKNVSKIILKIMFFYENFLRHIYQFKYFYLKKSDRFNFACTIKHEVTAWVY